MRNSRRIALIAAALAVSIGVWGGQSRSREAVRASVDARHSASARARALPIASEDGRTLRASDLRGGSPAGAAPGANPLADERVTAAPADRHVPPERALRGGSSYGSEASAGGAVLPRLDPVRVEAGAVTAAVSGSDPAAPRRLTLWRVEGGRAARLAETTSGPDGRFQFPEVATAGSELAVSGDGPATEDGRAPVRLPVLEPGAPSVELLAADPDVRLRIWPSAAATGVVVAAGGREIARSALSTLPDVRGRMLDLRIAPSSGERTLWVAEERADGSRSAWRSLEMEGPAPKALGSTTTTRGE